MQEQLNQISIKQAGYAIKSLKQKYFSLPQPNSSFYNIESFKIQRVHEATSKNDWRHYLLNDPIHTQ